MTLQKQILKECDDFQTKQIQIVPGLFFNQYETINRIYFYYNSKFVTGDTDDEGDRKYFYNIVKNPCKVFSKSIDFDTKNIRPITVGGGNPNKTWFFGRDLNYWMRDKQFGKTLNRIFKELPIFGSVIIKVIEGTPYFVDLRNFIVEQSADTLEQSSYITEVYNLTVGEFRKIGKKMGWKQTDINNVIKRFHESKGMSHIKLLERYGDIADEKGNYTYKRTFVADVGQDEYQSAPNEQGQIITNERGVLLASEEWEGHPYWEFHTDKMSGRWLGVGVVESLFEPQVRANELCNVQAKATYWAGLHVFQSRATVNKNLKSDVRNGEVMDGLDSEITQVPIDERNMQFFTEEYTKWMKNRDELTFSYDVVQGERLPAGTPLGSAQISISQTLSYFETIQEDVALTVKEMLYKDIVPWFMKENKEDHTLRLVGQDLDNYIYMVKDDLVNHEVIRMTLTTGKVPTNMEKDAIGVAVEASIKQGKEKIIPLPKGFYDDLKYDIDIDITGESIDTRVRYATKFALLQAVTADPTMLTDKTKRKFLFSMAEDGGINPNDLFDMTPTTPADALPPTAPGRAGGGVSSPTQMQGNVPGNAVATM